MALKSRKNRPDGSRLVRGCWCRECKATCPVHVLGPLLGERRSGTKLFPQATAAVALRVLREMLGILGIPKAELYRTHDFRRGHAKDLQLSGVWLHVVRFACLCLLRIGAPLYRILAAGEWRSPAFLLYLDMHRSVVLGAVCGGQGGVRLGQGLKRTLSCKRMPTRKSLKKSLSHAESCSQRCCTLRDFKVVQLKRGRNAVS